MIGTPKAIYLMVLFIAFLIFTYTLQNLRFKNKLTESNTNIVAWLAGTIYIFCSAGLILGLQINFVAGGFLNLFTVSYLLKAISYAHVLQEVRDTIALINKGDKEFLESIPKRVI